MRSFDIVLAAVSLCWTLPAVAQDAAAPAPAPEDKAPAIAPLPEGDTGIAAKYPGDRGIEKDAAVVFADDFEQGLDKWNASYGKPEITHEPADVHSGQSAVKMILQWPRPERSPTNTGLMNHFDKGFDTLFLRYYAKYGKDLELYSGATHTGGCIFATTMDTHNIKAGVRADGKNQFTLRLDCNRSNDTVASPGNLIAYTYQPEQGSRYGDILFPSGRFLPDRRRTTPRPYGEPFVSRPDIIPQRDRWYCFEIMVQANTPGKHDGRMAFWVDGKLAADFPAVRVRDVEELKANLINISFYTDNRKVHGGQMWYDDVVAATSYIGPMVEEKQEKPALAPLPEGDLGIAAKYPGDAGIEKDPAVVFYDGFEDYPMPADLHKTWSLVIHEANIRFADEAANVHHGKRAIEFTVPQLQNGISVGMNKMLKEERDVLFLRFYSKYEKGFDQRGSCHSGGMISAHYYLNGETATPGVPADGFNKFLANFETERGQFPPPGPMSIYLYHPEQRGRFGDHLYPSGKVTPDVGPPASFGPNFVPRPDFIPELDRWYCYEYMLKANTAGQRDGRIACWVDGKLIADFPNLRLRDIDSLKIDCFGVALYINPNNIRANKKWFDDVVAATSYIGPMVEAKTSGRP